MAPLVSVAVATHNGARHLRAQLESILAQTWPNVEIVVSDDGSTDETLEIARAVSTGVRVRVVAHQERLGVAGNFGRAISECRGEYVALSDQDDVWKPEKIETLVGVLGSADLAYGRVEEVLEEDGSISTDPMSARITAFARRTGSGHPVRFLLAENWVVSHSLLFRRELASQALPFPPTYPHHDWWLALTAASRQGIVFVDRSLQVYRRHAQSVTYRSSAEHEEDRRRRKEEGLEGLRSRWRALCSRELRRLAETRRRVDLDATALRVVDRLEEHYSSGVRKGMRFRSAVAGLLVSPLFAARSSGSTAIRSVIRPLLAGL